MAFTLIDLAGGAGSGASEININLELQSKTVDSSTESQLVVPTDGYIGIKDVTVNPYVLDSSSAVITDNGEYVFESVADGLSRVDVSVNVVGGSLDEKTVDSSTVLQIVTSDVYGLRQVIVNPYTLDSKTVDSSTVSQVITSDADGLSQVTINPYVLSPLEVDSSTAPQELTGQYGTVTVNPYTLDSKTVDPSTNSQTITSDEDGLSSVTINPYTLDSKTVDSSTVSQTVVSSADGLSSVTVNPYTLDSKTVDSSTLSQVVVSDADGLSSVTVNPYTLDSKTVDSSTVAQTVVSSADGLSSVTVNPYTLDSKTIDPSTNQQTITSSEDGLSSVTVNGVTSSIDSNILAGNIKDGVTILGVQGTFEGGTLQSKTVDSSTVSQLVEPDSGNYGLSSVTVNPYTLDTSTLVATENGEYAVTSSADGLSRVDVSVNIDTSAYYNDGYSDGETAGIAEGIAQQKALLDSSTFTANATYTRADGWDEITVAVPIPTFTTQSKTIDSSINLQEVEPDSGYDGLSKVTVNAVDASIDSNIQAGNIKKDVVILGVTGTYDGSEPSAAPVEYISNEDDLNLVFNSGYIPNDSTKIVARIAWGGEGLGSWGNYFGIQNNFALREWGGYGSQTGEITWQTIGGTCNVKWVYDTPGDITIVRDIEVGNNYVISDSSSGSTGTYSGWISDYPMFIFGAADPGNGQLTELSSREMRIHSFAIYEGTTLIKNLVPFQDASLNGCFYDTVSDTYIYPLQGTPTVGPVAIYQQKVVDASLNAIEVTADAGFEALSKVTVNGVTAAVDPNITPGNIKAGVNILGVGGSFAGAIYHRIGYVANNATNKKIYRNTGIIPTNNTRIEATISFDDIPTGEGGYGYFYGTTSGATFDVREFGGYGSRNVSYVDGNGTGYYSSDMSSAPRTYVCGQVENDYSFMSYGGYIDKRSTWSYTWSTGDDIFIWAGNKGNDTVDEYATRVMRLYDFKIYEGDTLVFHGVPAADNDGNAILLDLVSNKMVEGDGTLTGGGVYVEVDEDNYVENGTYDRTDGTVYFNLGDQLNLYDLSDSNNVKEYFEIVASVPKKNTGSSNGFQYIAGNVSRSESYFGVGMYGYTNGMFYTQSSTPAQTTTANSPGMHKYTLMGYKNNNSTYYGGWICGYIDDTTVAVVQLTLSNTLYSGDVYLFTANTNGAPGSTYMCTKGTRIYQIKYYKPSDGLVHVLVPAYNNNQYCFHDLISNTYLYASAGTPTGHLKDKYLTNNGAINVYNA